MAGKPLIAIVDDEPDILSLVSLHLKRAGFNIQEFRTGEEFLFWLEKNNPDLIILDLMLPDRDGREICKSLRNSDRSGDLPIIMLTALGHEVDRIIGLETGADDYITKPFSPRELVARVKAVLRRAVVKEKYSVLSAAGIKLDTERFITTVSGQEVKLTSTEFKLLAILMKGRGRVFSRRQILEQLWQGEKIVFDRTIDVHIRNIRIKLGSAGKFIKNIRGVGYKLEV